MLKGMLKGTHKLNKPVGFGTQNLSGIYGSAIREVMLERRFTKFYAHWNLWSYLLVAAGATFFSYVHLFSFSFIPIWRFADEAIYLEHAERMLHGQIPYRDFFQFNLPGTEYLYYFLMRIFGVRLWVGHVAWLVSLILVTVLIYALSRVVLHGVSALIPPVAFAAIGERTALDATHHWYSTVLVLLAILLIARDRSLRRLAIAGAILGLATLFTSTRGIFAAVGVALFLVWEIRNRREAFKSIATLFAPLFAILASTLLLLALLAGPRVFVQSVFNFPLRYYSAGGANSFSVFFTVLEPLSLHPTSLLGDAVWLAVNFALPFILIAFAVRCYRKGSRVLRASDSERTLVLYAMVSLFLLLAVLGAPTAPRMNCALTFSYILATAMLVDVGSRRLVICALAIMVTGAVAEIAGALLRPKYFAYGPRGPVAFITQDGCEFLSWFIRNSHSGDLLWGDADISFLLGLENPASIQWVERDAYTRPEQVSDLLSTLNRRKTRFIVYFEIFGRGTEDNLQPLRDFLRQHYHVVEKRSDDPSIDSDVPAGPDCTPVLIRNAL